MNTSIKNKIIDIAEKSPSKEVCGYIYFDINGEAGIIQSTNTHLNSDVMFTTDEKDYISLSESSNTIVGVYHSHTIGDESFSDQDISYAETWELPLYVYSIKSKKWNSYVPDSYKPNLIGRQFCWGFSDCYEIVRDYYKLEFNIKISDYDRDNSFEGSNNSIIIDSFGKEGFERIPDGSPIMKDDVIVFNSNRLFPHHLSVFIGRSKMIHHPRGRLSEVCMLNKVWNKKISMILRYQG